MFTYVASNGAQHQVELSDEELFEGPKASGLSPRAYVNRKFSDADPKLGTAFSQFQASVGICDPSGPNEYGLSQVSMATLIGFGANVQQNTSPFGVGSRALTMITIIDKVESKLAKDLTTDANNFDGAVGHVQTIHTEHFEQPVISYDGLGGPEQAKSSRVSQGANPPKMAFITTADRIRRIGSWGIGLEYSDQALKATSLDLVTLTVERFLARERDARAQRYISELFLGNNDMITGAVTSVTSTILNGAATAGVMTHKAWVKFLARNRKYRAISHVFCTIGTYLKIEGRTGRPGTTNYDPTLSRIDPQAVAMNQTFGGNVKFVIVDDFADGGPVPEDTVYAVDARSAITLVRNSAAAYTAIERYALRRTEAMVWQWGEEAYRTFGDVDLKAFDVLVID